MQDQIGQRMKQIELNPPLQINSDLPFIVRLDGHSFSKFTKNFKSQITPFDLNFMAAMVNTMNDLLQEFNAQTGYTHSDEITLIFAPAVKNEEDAKLNKVHIFNGRVNKIISLMAGFCSVRFNFHIINLIRLNKSQYTSETLSRIEAMKAYFDARVLVFSEEIPKNIVEHQIWRSIFDSNRNALSTFTRFHYSHKQVNNKKSQDMIQMLKDKGIEWQSIPLHLRHGIYAKKYTYIMEAVDQKTKDQVECIRTAIGNKCFKIQSNEEKFYPLLISKYWNSEQVQACEVEDFKLELLMDKQSYEKNNVQQFIEEESKIKIQENKQKQETGFVEELRSDKQVLQGEQESNEIQKQKVQQEQKNQQISENVKQNIEEKLILENNEEHQ